MRIHPSDNVEVNLENGHKYAIGEIAKGEQIIKYGFPIGHATEKIGAGEQVHSHNMKSNLEGVSSYTYHPDFTPLTPTEPKTFMGYRRKNGGVGIRNDIWIVNTVGCVNAIASRLAAATGALAFPHPFGCSQLGEDHEITRLILRGMVRHPNAGGVLVLGLGCENNHIASFQEILGETDPERVIFLNLQDVEDDMEAGIEAICRLQEAAAKDKREEFPTSMLKVGLKCGGSDGYSGITANPLVGRFSDRLIAGGGTCLLTEVPEMFGAEEILLRRCVDREVFDRAVDMITKYQQYFLDHGQPVNENPSPGNKAGGITTLEEKSLGCVQKGGSAPVTDVLNYGDFAVTPGLNLLNGPGNDLVAITNLMAVGAHMILFTTGRGTPLGSAVPTLKIATNHALAERKKGWIDLDASVQDADDLWNLVIAVANGQQTKNEENGYREISIYKDGVTL